MDNLDKLLEVENQIEEIIQDLKQEIVYEIRHTIPSKGDLINDNIFIINFLDLQKGFLAPEYYIPLAQARYVEEALKTVVTTRLLVKKIEEMITNKNVQLDGNIYHLNDTTLNILKKYSLDTVNNS